MGRRRTCRRPIAFIAVVILTAACYGPGAQPLEAPRQRDVITGEEIAQSNAAQGDAYQVIQSLRPQLLSSTQRVAVNRGSALSNPVAVYVDGTRQPNGTSALRSIAAMKVAEIRYLEPIAALNEFGPVASGGALVVKLRKPDPDG